MEVGKRKFGVGGAGVKVEGWRVADTFTPEQRRRCMAAIRSKDTKPEMAVRRAVHALGYRFRLHRRDLPGRPDLTLPRHRKVIFVHGCFWHGHDCKAGARLPASNVPYWTKKRADNQRRDAAALAKLAELGWAVLTVWECEIRQAGFLGRVLGEFFKQARRR